MVQTVGQRMWNSPIKAPAQETSNKRVSGRETGDRHQGPRGGNLHTTPITENEF